MGFKKAILNIRIYTTIVCYGVQVFLASISPHFLLFGHEPKLPNSIQRDVMAILNLDESNVWVQHVNK
jgi:hypothetical protein